MVAKIKSFILELGRGFTFMGNQYRLEYNNKEYFVDMLFFHRGLRSLVAIESENKIITRFGRIEKYY